mmetsp:Transcript_29011/g.48742  ORF Transcript_29011/g.48742 Transcript_29011/m.48742 type:complete len:246 (-) Transcript_29011:862-1599(-)
MTAEKVVAVARKRAMNQGSESCARTLHTPTSTSLGLGLAANTMWNPCFFRCSVRFVIAGSALRLHWKEPAVPSVDHRPLNLATVRVRSHPLAASSWRRRSSSSFCRFSFSRRAVSSSACCSLRLRSASRAAASISSSRFRSSRSRIACSRSARSSFSRSCWMSASGSVPSPLVPAPAAISRSGSSCDGGAATTSSSGSTSFLFAPRNQRVNVFQMRRSTLRFFFASGGGGGFLPFLGKVKSGWSL